MTISKSERFILAVIVTAFCCLMPGVSRAYTPLIAKYLSPRNGSFYVSKQTSIIIKPGDSLNASSVSSRLFIVSGSISKLHSGTAVLSDDHRTVVFKPSVEFSVGERVTAQLISGLRTTNGKILGGLIWSFTISKRKAISTEGGIANNSFNDSSALNDDPVYALGPDRDAGGRLAVDSIPSDFPVINPTYGSNPAPGRIFMSSFEATYYQSTVTPYLLILNNDGSPYWYKRLAANAIDFKVQPTGLLTYYDASKHLFYGLDSSYMVVDSFMCGDGLVTDLHDCWLLPNGHALLIACDTQQRDLSGFIKGGNPQAEVIGAVIQEIDKAKNVVFQWSSFDYFKFEDAIHQNFTTQYLDYVHANSIMQDTDGNLILSSRHLDEVTKINRETGAIIWRMGGQHNEFKFLNDTLGFSHQHAVRRTAAGTITLFDNGNYHPVPNSRALEYNVDEQAKTCELVWQYHHVPEIQTAAMGNVERLSNGNTMVSWGLATSSPALTEVNPDGSLAYELTISTPNSSYRAFRFPWSPTTAGVKSNQSSSFSLEQNYPNPFNPSTTIRYTLDRSSHVTLTVFDMMGRTVQTLDNGLRAAGSHQVHFDASGLASGSYICRIQTDLGVRSEQMMLVK
jgi:hypothetical protein